MYRSESMSYYRIIFTKDSEKKMLERLGRLGYIQFDNLHKSALVSSLPFETQLKDVNGRLEKIIEIENYLIAKGYLEEKEQFNLEHNELILDDLSDNLKKESNSKFYNDLFEIVDQRYFRIKEQLDQVTTLEKKIENTKNVIEVLQVLKTQLPESFTKYERRNYSGTLSLDYFAGTIDSDSVYQIQKSLFRITRGNAYVTYNTIGNGRCCVFIAVQSTESGGIKEKINRICQSMSFSMITVPNDTNELAMTLELNKIDLLELKNVMFKTKEILFDLISKFIGDDKIAPYTRIYELKTLLLKQFCLLTNMNYLNYGKTFTTGCFWMPDVKKTEFNNAIEQLRKNESECRVRYEEINYKELNKKPPTSFRTKGFFDSFQLIVDTYGIARYKEGNPGLFTAVTFPFLFGCMFGDIGHGLGLLIFSILIFAKPEWFSRQFIAVKYIFLLMGLFAFWCGWVYNDFFAIPMLAMNSCYTPDGKGGIHRVTPDCVYPIGIDYAWSQSKNDIPFINSFKMKISIVYGVIQMLGGILIKGSNELYFGNMIEFYTEFIPQMLFMICTFGYMSFCIIIKWLTDFSADTSKAPMIIGVFINLVGDVTDPLYGTAQLQQTVQQTLVLITLLCVPIMLLGKPIIGIIKKNRNRHDQKHRQSEHGHHDELVSLMSHEQFQDNRIQKEEEVHEDLSEIFIHQGIETIEFVLGSVSNTASYLRIWALSLAHSQLAKVFLEMLFKGSILGENSVWHDIPMAVIMFTMFILVTIAVLMLMDLLECFLHTLRLHWVEFQSKFYKGDGLKFTPFSFADFVDSSLS